MTYTRTTWVDQEDPAHDPDVDPTICAATLNNIEQGIVDAHDLIAGGAGIGDMLKSTYDTNNDGKVNAAVNADAVPWTGVTDKPSFGSTEGTFCQGNDTRLVDNAKQADRPFVFQTGHTAWATGLSNEEIGRIQLQTGETLYIRRVELQIKGGGTSSSLSVNAYDSTNTTTIASQTAGGVNTTGGNSGAAALVLIRLTNSVGSTQSASVYISGWIRS